MGSVGKGMVLDLGASLSKEFIIKVLTTIAQTSNAELSRQEVVVRISFPNPEVMERKTDQESFTLRFPDGLAISFYVVGQSRVSRLSVVVDSGTGQDDDTVEQRVIEILKKFNQTHIDLIYPDERGSRLIEPRAPNEFGDDHYPVAELTS